MIGADQHESGARFWYATMRITPFHIIRSDSILLRSNKGELGAHTADVKQNYQDHNSLTGRVWLVFGHAEILVGMDHERAFLNEAKKRGQLIDPRVHARTSTYLFHFPAFELKSDAKGNMKKSS